MMMKEMPLDKQVSVLTPVKQMLAKPQATDHICCTITSPIHEWILPPGDLQRMYHHALSE
jgi:hypothetical protein